MNRCRFLLVFLLSVSPIAHAVDESTSETSRISDLFACQMFFSASYQAASDPVQKEKLRRISLAFLRLGAQAAVTADPNKDLGNHEFSVRIMNQGKRKFKAFMTKVHSLPQAERNNEYGKFVGHCLNISGHAKR